ncbi:unnamed protein product [Trifolium pratense]|uniref:Uncharacterized protein n=1 Tax=Trifolium pratense TaxID=57577 RepID=A0ACB0KTF0_TRIPR|nr:unnamed protein product [Trifolium pratense]
MKAPIFSRSVSNHNILVQLGHDKKGLFKDINLLWLNLMMFWSGCLRTGVIASEA